ncbi:MAG: hypothetical protein IPM79_07895 [Polyangiaceae bacterium]|nr:hypothetical protein [Polyangiaceae bacterium]MBK8937555.1 hypothetical protein [Polyangiaceae bacterium]
MSPLRAASLFAVASLGAGCGPEAPTPPAGVDVPEGPCGHALYVLSSDYQSTNVSVLGWDGVVLSDSIVSSASRAPGLSVALSGDVTAPTDRTSSGEIVVLDRYPAAALTFVDPTTATVRDQLSLQTGFASNPQDYLEVAPDKAYVTRYAANPEPGREPFDEGSDVLIIDPSSATISGRIDLQAAMAGAEDGILPRPSRLVATEDTVFALLSAYSLDFSRSGEGRVAAIDPQGDQLLSFVELTGARGCASLALSSSGSRLAVGCSGTFGGTSTPTIEDAAVLVFDVAGAELSLVARWSAQELGGDPLGLSLDFVSDGELLLSTLGRLDDEGEQVRPDRLLALSIEDGATRELLRSDGAPFTLGDVRCEAACGACFVADADHGAVQRVNIVDGRAEGSEAVVLDDGIGLPPRYLGAY